jgi:hypothetical protein
MSFYDKQYRSVTGKSRGWGSMRGFVNNLDFRFHKTFVSSPHARLRSGLAVLTLAGVITYLSHKESVDESLNSWRDNYVENKEYKRLLREELKASDNLAVYKDEFDRLKNDYQGLLNKKDSLVNEVNSLEVQIDITNSYDDLKSLNSQIENSKSKLDSLDSAIDNVSPRRGFLGLFRRRVADEVAPPVRKYNTSVWTPIPQGGSLSGIAKKYYGDASLWEDVARINNIKNPNLVVVGSPIKLDVDKIINYEGIYKGNFPSFKPVLRNETLDDFISRQGISVSKKAVLDYNISSGNNISPNGLLVRETGVVYLKDTWSGRGY